MFVKCVGYNTDHERFFTIGKIYEWNGTLVSDRGYVYKEKVEGDDPSRWSLRHWYEFEVVGEETELDTDKFEIPFESILNGVSKKIITTGDNA